jgi:hypothetical protein
MTGIRAAMFIREAVQVIMYDLHYYLKRSSDRCDPFGFVPYSGGLHPKRSIDSSFFVNLGFFLALDLHQMLYNSNELRIVPGHLCLSLKINIQENVCEFFRFLIAFFTKPVRKHTQYLPTQCLVKPAALEPLACRF